MSVIPFDREHPFPPRDGNGTPAAAAAAMRLAVMEHALRLALRENARNRARAQRAEARIDELTAQMMRDQLAEPPAKALPKVG